MKLYAPDYYKSFACIADRCRHSCCLGWEIDIDPDTRDFYRTVGGEIGLRLQESIDDGEETACFRMGADERCPFLNRSGLCDLILSLGEESLCQICADHPRFRSFFADRTEIGLGLCCEEATRLVLSWKDPVQLEIIEDDGMNDESDSFEEELLALRGELISVAQDRSLTVDERAQRILARSGLKLPVPDPELILSLERLDEAWTECINQLWHFSGATALTDEFDIPFEQLLVYLLYRHLPLALEDGEVSGHISFCVWCWLLIRLLCCVHMELNGSLALEDMAEVCRMYSSEIEYSDENIAAIIDHILS